MENDNKDLNPDRIRKLIPEKESRTSLFLNGIGNGMMVGTIPFVGLELYARLTNKEIPKSAHIGSAFATVIGCTIGGYFGLREADKLKNYRRCLVDDLTYLHQKAANCDAPQIEGQEWSKKERQKEISSTEPTR